jgi:Uma2 family endonuclease
MTSSVPRRKYAISDYVELENYSNVRHEYLGGEIYAMAGGTPEHGTYAANVIALLAARLAGQRCRVQTSDVRIRVKATGLDTYPDVSVVCGYAERDLDDPNAVVNPTVLVEITSPSTEEYDRGEKLEHYKKIPSLREVLLVAHGERRVEVVRRLADGSWAPKSAGPGGSVTLVSLDAELSVDEIYRDALAE